MNWQDDTESLLLLVNAYRFDESEGIMKTIYVNGIEKDEPTFLDDSAMFYIQELNQDASDRYVYPNDSIKYQLDGELVVLYDTLRDVFFENTKEYYEELNCMPIFVQSAGQDSDCGLTAEVFAEWIQGDTFNKFPNFYKHLYLVDCQFLVGTIQNLLCGMEDSFIRYYQLIAALGKNLNPSEPSDYSQVPYYNY